jgi:hypothetical protein
VHVVRVATGPALAALAVIVAGGIVFWCARRRRQLAAAGLTEAACPACLALAYLSEQPADLQALTLDDARTEQSRKPTTPTPS